ncbi:MAG: MoxR family ATPase [Lachnospiraceae bacterium]|nr:MoxR family ATPase [Lachnospiraceae bacterium]
MRESTKKLFDAVNKRFIGHEDVTENVIICLLSGGHVLLEDVPGVGKTTLAKTIAKATNLDFGRIQFTPDTLPSDVTGVQILNMKTGEFELREGSVMHQLVLADEINRTSPKTQSALLEAMAEGFVTIDKDRIKLPEPFMVIATQNPIEFVGTYPLPEAQTDRFMMKLSVGYPKPESEIEMAKNFLSGDSDASVEVVMNADEITALKKEVEKVKVVDDVIAYADDIIAMTRKESSFVMGASPRAMLHLLRAAQAKAFIHDRDFVKPDDIKAVAINTLHHRISLTYEAKIAKEDIDKLLKAIIVKAKVPMV